MKLLVAFCIFVTIACASAASVPQAIYVGPTYELRPIEDPVGDDMATEMVAGEDSEGPIRHRRVTCDVLSVATLWVTVNDSACAVRCLTQGRKGGRCENGVCVCR
ncbi:defensin 2 [Ptiloglossa arizonensis]|uniref:defensin 2 n=1 Tax=Ptiloglossa arizonensis TaxID=3350558 RepID=UPI003FA00C48